MTPRSRLRLAHLLLFLTPGFWSANYIVARAAVGVIEPHMLAFLRWLLAFLLMLVFAWPALRRHWPHWLGEWKDLLLFGALGMWICGAFVYIGGQTTVATNISLIYAISPVMIAVVSAVWFKDRLRPLQIAGVVLAVVGVLLIIAKGSVMNLIRVQFTTGDWWIVAAATSWTLYSLLLPRRKTVLDPFARLTAITFGGIVVLLPLTIIEAAAQGLPEPSLKVVTLALVVALLPGFGAYQSYSYIQRELGPARAGLTLYLGPVWAAVVSWVLLGEAPQWFHLVGAALILPGIWLATRSAHSKG